MSLNLDENGADNLIRGYKPGFLKINDVVYQHSLIVSAQTLIIDWAPQSIQQLEASSLQVILEIHPAILLIGTGDKLIFPPVETYGELLNHGIGVEIMNTSAACRTYNALTAEGRSVVAALIL